MKATLCAMVTVVVLFLVVSLCKTSYGYEICVLVTEYTVCHKTNRGSSFHTLSLS